MKKIMILLLVILLTASAAIGVTLAYLTDSDEDVNVMTVGNIFIEQHEKERDEQGNFVDYEDNKPFYPAVYPGDFDFNTPTVELPGTGCKLWDASLIENANDKIVTVTNTGASDCYVRTWFAFEDSGSNVYCNTNTADWSWSSIMQDVTIAGTVYDLYAATYPTALKPGQTTPPSLLQYALSRYASNQDIASFGDTYEILVFSQAVQTQGFTDAEHALDAAFGPVITNPKAKNNPWNGLNGLATSAASLKSTFANGGNIVIGSHITVTDHKAGAANVINKDASVSFDDSILRLDIPDATDSTANRVGVNVEGGTVVFDGTTGGIQTAPNSRLCAIAVGGGADLTVNGGTYLGGDSVITVTDGMLTINGGYFASQSSDTGFTIDCADEAYRNETAVVVIQGGSFLNWNPADNAAEGEHTNFVPVGSRVISTEVDGGTLYTVVPE